MNSFFADVYKFYTDVILVLLKYLFIIIFICVIFYLCYKYIYKRKPEHYGMFDWIAKWVGYFLVIMWLTLWWAWIVTIIYCVIALWCWTRFCTKVFLWFIACYISFVLLKDYERLKKEFNESFNSQGNIFGESVSKFFFRRFFSQSVVAQYTAIFVAKVYWFCSWVILWSVIIGACLTCFCAIGLLVYWFWLFSIDIVANLLWAEQTLDYTGDPWYTNMFIDTLEVLGILAIWWMLRNFFLMKILINEV